MSSQEEREIIMAIRLVVWFCQLFGFIGGLIGAIWQWESFVCAIVFIIWFERAKPELPRA